MSQATSSEPSSRSLPPGWRTYRLFGLTLSSDFPFANQLTPATGTPDLTFTCTSAPPLPGGWEQVKPSYASPHFTEDGERIAYLYRLDSCDVLRFAHVANFYLWPERIVCHLLEPTCHYLAEIRLLGPVLSFWLERLGIPALHASAVVAHDRALVFLSTNSGGKSALAAAFMQAAYPLLTDDILPVEFVHGTCVGRPGYPQMRLWPDEARYFLGHYEDLPQVHPAYSKRRVPVGRSGFGSFCAAARPLACLYLPERCESAAERSHITILPLPRRQAVIELVRNSFAAGLAQAIGLQPQRLELFARMVQQVPMRRLLYPSGFEHLPRVGEAILRDLANLA
jgi:hypothetical protein